MAQSLEELALMIGETEDAKVYGAQFEDILKSIDLLHWNEKEKTYSDLTVNLNGTFKPR